MTNQIELLEFLYGACKQNSDFLYNVLSDHISRLDDDGLNELEDILVNNFGDD